MVIAVAVGNSLLWRHKRNVIFDNIIADHFLWWIKIPLFFCLRVTGHKKVKLSGTEWERITHECYLVDYFMQNEFFSIYRSHLYGILDSLILGSKHKCYEDHSVMKTCHWYAYLVDLGWEWEIGPRVQIQPSCSCIPALWYHFWWFPKFVCVFFFLCLPESF